MKSWVLPGLSAALSMLAGAVAAEPYWGGNIASRTFDWAATPSPDEVTRIYPAEQIGDVAYVYDCGLGTDGRLLDCRLSKTQGEAGPAFERAARALLLRYRVAPVTADGLRTPGLPVTVWLLFRAESRSVAAGGSAVTFVPWSQGPDRAAFDRAYPTEAKASVSAAFGCAAGPDGGLVGCEDLSSTPNPAYQARARSLLPLYRVPTVTAEGLRTEGLPLVVQFDLTEPGVPPPPIMVPRPPNPWRASPLLVGAVEPVRSPTGAAVRKIGADFPVTVLRFVAADRQCRAAPVEIVVTRAAEHGRVEIEDTESLVGSGRLSATDPRQACVPTSFAGKRVVYTPQPGYAGPDEVVVSLRSDGQVFEQRTQFEVQP